MSSQPYNIDANYSPFTYKWVDLGYILSLKGQTRKQKELIRKRVKWVKSHPKYIFNSQTS